MTAFNVIHYTYMRVLFHMDAIALEIVFHST